MRKLGLLLLLLVGFSFAADDYYITTGTQQDSTFQYKYVRPFRRIYRDTITFHAENGDSTINLGFLAYNAQIRSLNGAGDSGSVKISFDSDRGFWHDDSIARNLQWAAVGLNTADDYLFAPIEFKYIYVRPVVGGTADSTAVIEFIWFR